MSVKLCDNKIKINELATTLDSYTEEKTFALKSVGLVKKKDGEGKATDIVEAVRYSVVDISNYNTFTVKVMGATPVVTNEMVEQSDETIYITIPTDQTLVKPYEISYGTAKLSIQAPYVELSKGQADKK